MKYDNETIKRLQYQLNHVLKCYGDEPSELIYKLECLILEWYEKGLNGESKGVQTKQS